MIDFIKRLYATGAIGFAVGVPLLLFFTYFWVDIGYVLGATITGLGAVVSGLLAYVFLKQG